MNILFIGDVVGDSGCEFIRRNLYKIKQKHNIDFIIANGENSSENNGISPESADMLFASGVDFITTGNHVFRESEIKSYLDERRYIIRPLNYMNCHTGRGQDTYDAFTYKISVVNLQGSTFMTKVNNPFQEVEKELKEIDSDIIIVDFHCEATSEKRAMGFFLDGKVTAVIGTHTHVQTADAQILPEGTAYITDAGMTGPSQSILGVEKSIIIDRFYNDTLKKFQYAETPAELNGVIIKLDEKFKAVAIENITER